MYSHRSQSPMLSEQAIELKTVTPIQLNLRSIEMNFSTQIKHGVVALVLCSAIGAFATAHAETTAARMSAADVAPTRIDVVTGTVAGDNNAHYTTRVHVGRPLTVSANPTPREIARASR